MCVRAKPAESRTSGSLSEEIEGKMEALGWFFATGAPSDWLGPVLRAILACALIYQLDVLFLVARLLVRKLCGSVDDVRLPADRRPAAVLVLPTLLRNEDELYGLQRAMASAAQNGYPAELLVVACVDDMSRSAKLVERLEHWTAAFPASANVRFAVTGTAERAGKAMAMEAGIEHVAQLVERGELSAFPPVFFNMDADSELASGTLERMVYRLTERRRIAKSPHLIVASNVSVRTSDCMRSWRDLLTPGAWISLLVAREYMTSIGLARNNGKFIPVTGVSGALYCTWSEVQSVGPRYAAFMQTLRWRDWARWWLGRGAPRFSKSTVEPRPEAMTGPGDDTWITWMACSGWWANGRICFDFPRTPLHALARLVIAYVSRPLAYDPRAIVYTKTPTTVRGLFNQRLRWNSSRVQDVQRWCRSHAFHWTIGMPVLAGLSLIVVVNGGVMIGLVLSPFLPGRVDWLPVLVLSAIGYYTVRVVGSVAAMAIAGTTREDWPKLISLPFSGPYHFAFNVVTTAIGFTRDIFGFGLPTTFSPESTLKRSGLSRIALAYRIRRALLLAWRSVLYGDVPFGRFWFGWRETPWTPNGFEGWTTGRRPPAVYPRVDTSDQETAELALAASELAPAGQD